MANYISTLTGVQMDAAMTDMANHVSEAWAVGERDGRAVSSGDVTYHNNSKYYANQASTQIADGVARAESAAARAEAAVPPSTAGAVFFDREQSLTEAQGSQAKANIKVSNENLLDNWYFVGGGSQAGEGAFPINTKGLSSYSDAAGYTIDRWWCSASGMTVAFQPDCVRVTSTASINLRQNVGAHSGIYTFSAYMRGTGSILLRFLDESIATIKGSSTITLTNTWTLYSVTIDTIGEATGDFCYVSFRCLNGTQADIQMAKLERGAISTLPNDTPPNYGVEMLKCSASGFSQGSTFYNRPYIPYTRPNLLDNSYFVGGGSQLGGETFPINQKGQVSYTGSVGMIDRWKGLNGNGTMTLTADGLVFSNSAAGYGYIKQTLARGSITSGHCLSVIANGTLYTARGLSSGITLPSGLYFYFSSSTSVDIRVPANLNASETISYIKLEEGFPSSAVGDNPPVFTNELLNCQRYLWVETFPANTQICTCTSVNATTVVGNLVAPAPLRANPTITFSANVGLVSNGAIAVATGVTSAEAYGNNIRIVLASTGLSSLNLYSFITQTNTTMTVSADL